MYTPVHTATGYLQTNVKKYSFNVSAQYSSRRFTDSSGSTLYALDAYALINIYASRFWIVNHHRFDLGLSAKNITNVDYQLYGGRAMPGINYSIQLTYQLNQKQK
jgi:outer membrane receptor protein involved in Fe transport